MKKIISILLAIVAVALSVVAVDAQKPTFRKYVFDDKGFVGKLSDNGKWGVEMYGTEELREASRAAIVNVATGEKIQLQTEAEIKDQGRFIPSDVTDDGNIVVGLCGTSPAYWSRATKSITTLPYPEKFAQASVTEVTPDGKYAVGEGWLDEGGYAFDCIMWEVATEKIIDLPNMPVLDMNHGNINERRVVSMSADGRYLLGNLSYIYIDDCAVFLYDRQTGTYVTPGFDSSDTKPWKAWDSSMIWACEGKVSPNGKYVALHAYCVTSSVEGDAVALYNVETGDFQILPESIGMLCGGVDNNGNVYAASPATTPLRSWSVFRNGYWYAIDQILSQHYGVNYENATKFENTGTVMDYSADGMVYASMVDPQFGESYTLTMPDAIGTVCDGINLLARYAATPANNTTFSNIRTVEILFDRNIEVLGAANCVALTKADGTLVRNSSGFAVSSKSPRTLLVTYRATDLAQGETYTVTIPAGSVCVAGDKSKTNNEIKLTYYGRSKSNAVSAVEIRPKEGSKLSRIDGSNNAVFVTYDCQVTLVTDEKGNAIAQAGLYQKEDGGETKICDLNLAVFDQAPTVLFIYPTAEQFLYEDKQYCVKVDAGAVTDLSGNSASAAIELNYEGTYVRPVSHDTAILFSEDFSNTSTAYANLKLYEGDHNKPNSEAASYQFNADNTPWYFQITETAASTDACAGSSSMYSPAGKSDDWMIIPNLEIPDRYVNLLFQAQRLRKTKADRLKVIVWANAENISYFTDDVIARFRAEGKVMFDEELKPAVTEDNLADGWVDYTIDLGGFAGKTVYIAFVNENYDQSVILVDNIVVKREMKFFIALANDETVVQKSQIDIKGNFTSNAEGEVFKSAKFVLQDASGAELDRVEATGLNLAKGETYQFAFSKPLPLVVGQNNKFTIHVEAGEYSDDVRSSVKDLSFAPVKRVVLEEGTGMACPNCPRGILAIEHLQELYKDKFIPISIHTYTGDVYGAGLQGYTNFLGIIEFPKGVVNRNGVPCAGLLPDKYTFKESFTRPYEGGYLWADYVAEEFKTPAEAEISAKYEILEEEGRFNLPITVKYALDAVNLNLNLFIVMLEDGLPGYQESNVYTKTDAIFGQWGEGGIYGKKVNENYIFNDVAVTTWGATYNGTGGLLPTTMEAGEEYTTHLNPFDIPESVTNIDNTKIVVMLIDGNSDRLINSVCVKANGDSGVSDVTTDMAACNISTLDGDVIVAAAGDLDVAVYALDGTLIGAAQGRDAVSISAERRGIAIVRAAVNGIVTVKKITL